MSCRFILGKRGSEYGLWISKPGLDANSTSDDDLLVSPARYLTRPLLTGRVYAAPNGKTSPTQSNTAVSMVVDHNLGYIPVVEILGADPRNGTQNTAIVTTTQVLLNGLTSNSFRFQGAGAPSGTYYYAVDVYYAIFANMMSAS